MRGKCVLLRTHGWRVRECRSTIKTAQIHHTARRRRRRCEMPQFCDEKSARWHGRSIFAPNIFVECRHPRPRHLAFLGELVGIARKVEQDLPQPHRSTVSVPRASGASTTRRSLFCWASRQTAPMTSSISGPSCTVWGQNSNFPASIWRGRAPG
jgi:hypothetical protein